MVIIKTSLIFSKSCFEFFSFTYVPFEKSSTLKKKRRWKQCANQGYARSKSSARANGLIFFFTFLELKCSMDLKEKKVLKLRLLKFQDLAASN